MYTTEKKVQIVTWGNSGLSLNAVSDFFANSFPEWATPNPLTISRRFLKLKRQWTPPSVWASVRESVNGKKYLELLQSQIIPAFNAPNLDNDEWFKHDGCPAHNHRAVNDYLNRKFPNVVG
ncbi:hypothetical protein ILUMI_10663 [Ignelater luminosus]|uniref:Transposase n=1 Tax=Ignelater luminosus TaxID=2038154 RepID=A0A8K0G8G9_IGNLU|nr:hypothetical protein ILUMI_10663 [Ignelater luminosus]